MHRAATSRVRTETVYIGFAAEQYETSRIESAMHARPRPPDVKLRAGHGGMATKRALKIDGHEVPVSNLDKIIFPAAGFTKGQVIDYYTRIAPFMLPHLKDRPVTLVRYPDGVAGEHFYEKNAPAFTPDWVKTFPVPRRSGESPIRYIVIDNLAALIWCANLASLEFHPFLHRVPAIDAPTAVAFDLDPGEGVDILNCAEVAILLKAALERLKLDTFPKVTGSKGIQLFVPLNTKVTYDATHAFVRGLAEHMEREYPDVVISKMRKAARAGKVFIDWSQNSDFKTTVCVYSLRAKHERPYVSVPVAWEELERARKSGDSTHLYFEPDAALKRVKHMGDLFSPVSRLKQKLPHSPAI
jgi:bifunctional non-homologous end joining protein LigD